MRFLILPITLFVIISCRPSSDNPDLIIGRTWVPTESENSWVSQKISEFIALCGPVNGKNVFVKPVLVRTENIELVTKGYAARIKGNLMESGAFISEGNIDKCYVAEMQINTQINAINSVNDEYVIVYTFSLRFADPNRKVLHMKTFKISSNVYGSDRPSKRAN